MIHFLIEVKREFKRITQIWLFQNYTRSEALEVMTLADIQMAQGTTGGLLKSISTREYELGKQYKAIVEINGQPSSALEISIQMPRFGRFLIYDCKLSI